MQVAEYFLFFHTFSQENRGYGKLVAVEYFSFFCTFFLLNACRLQVVAVKYFFSLENRRYVWYACSCEGS